MSEWTGRRVGEELVDPSVSKVAKISRTLKFAKTASSQVELSSSSSRMKQHGQVDRHTSFKNEIQCVRITPKMSAAWRADHSDEPSQPPEQGA